MKNIKKSKNHYLMNSKIIKLSNSKVFLGELEALDQHSKVSTFSINFLQQVFLNATYENQAFLTK